MIRYRIRVGINQFADPHYVTKLGYSPSCTSIFVNKQPCSWKQRKTAEKHLLAIKDHFKTAEIEEFDDEP